MCLTVKVKRWISRFVVKAVVAVLGVAPRLKPTDMAFLRQSQERLGAEDPIFAYEVRPNPLSLLAELSGSDKGGLAPTSASGWAPHSYTRIYYPLLVGLRDEQLNLLEVGIGSNSPERLANMGEGGVPGASLRMWRDFFCRAEIFGADIDANFQFAEDRITTYVADVSSPNSITELLGKLPRPLNIVVDDASHVTEHILTLFELGFPYLAEGGFWFIEDVSKLNLVQVIERIRELAPEAYISYFAADSEADRSLRAILVVVRKLPK